MFENCLVPVHLKESSSRLEGLVRAVYRLGARRFRLFHVGGEGAGNRTRAQRLEKVAAALSSASARSGCEIHVDAQTTTGPAAVEIVRGATAWGADLVALPWKRKNWVQRSLLGSTSLDVLRLCDRPVFVDKASFPEEGDLLSATLATDFRGTTDTLINLFEDNTAGPLAVTLLNVDRRAPDPRAEETRINRVESALHELAGKISPDVTEVSEQAEVGKSGSVIPRVLRRNGSHLVILGKSSGPVSVLGSVAESVAYESPCSTLVVPAQEARNEQ